MMNDRGDDGRDQDDRANQDDRARIILVASTTAAIACGAWAALRRRRRERERRRRRRSGLGHGGGGYGSAHEALVGNTPLVRLPRLSALLRRDVFVKMESANPGGTPKDRAALFMTRDLPGSVETIVEGTSGSTGISLATLCAASGRKCVVFTPDDQAGEKRALLERLGAEVVVVPNCAVADPRHYVNRARRRAEELNAARPGTAVFTDQFENLANFRAHYETTGPEIHRQMAELHDDPDDDDGRPSIDAFVMSAGTGGTIAGVGTYLKERNSSVRIVLADPPGSSLYHRIVHGVAFVEQQRERSLRRHRYDTIAEGVGLDRITRNFARADGIVDDAVRVEDQEMVDMGHWILREEGLFVGSSSAANLVAAVRTAADLPVGGRVVTVVCDGGHRHLTRFWNRDFVVGERGLTWPPDRADAAVGRPPTPDCVADALRSVASA